MGRPLSSYARCHSCMLPAPLPGCSGVRQAAELRHLLATAESGQAESEELAATLRSKVSRLERDNARVVSELKYVMLGLTGIGI